MRLIERLGQLLTELLCDHFSDYGAMKPALQRHETNMSYISGHDPKEQVMSQSFRITADDDISWQAELLYSADAAESVMEFVQNKSVEAYQPLPTRNGSNNGLETCSKSICRCAQYWRSRRCVCPNFLT